MQLRTNFKIQSNKNSARNDESFIIDENIFQITGTGFSIIVLPRKVDVNSYLNCNLRLFNIS